MSCEKIQELLVDYYNRELPMDRRREVARHLGSCAACAIEYCRLEADLSGLRDLLELDEPSPDVKAKLAARVEAEFGSRPLRSITRLLARPLPIYQAALFASAIVVALAFFIIRRAPLPRPLPSSTIALTVIDGVDASSVVTVDRDVF